MTISKVFLIAAITVSIHLSGSAEAQHNCASAPVQISVPPDSAGCDRCYSTFSANEFMTRPVLTGLRSAGNHSESGSNTPASDQNVGGGKPRIGLDGYCAVCILKAAKWEKGSPQFSAVYDGVTYHFPNDNLKQMFESNPAAYVPAMNGDCIVCYAKAGKRMPGSVHHASVHQGRLFLFPSANEKKVFDSNPASFADADLALNGECAVCLVKGGHHVPGKADFAELHKGLRYLFPSQNEQQMFRADPTKYAAAAAMVNKSTAVQSLPSLDKVPTQNLVTVAGSAACAACEHGVSPLGHPDELGLAIVTADGQIVVVEQAHTRYPTEYKNRFQHQKLQVTGQIIKKEGKVSWLMPVTLIQG